MKLSILILLLIVSGTSFAQKHRVVKVDSIPGSDLERIVNLPVRQKLNEEYSGYYSVSSDSPNDLHGPFELLQFDSGAVYDPLFKTYDSAWIYVLKVFYSGNFSEGAKNGLFIESVHHDDGVDIYSKWSVSITFEDGKCKSGSFKGAIGNRMPETTHVFDKLDTCTFDHVVDKAWDIWSQEWKKREN